MNNELINRIDDLKFDATQYLCSAETCRQCKYHNPETYRCKVMETWDAINNLVEHFRTLEAIKDAE